MLDVAARSCGTDSVVLSGRTARLAFGGIHCGASNCTSGIRTWRTRIQLYLMATQVKLKMAMERISPGTTAAVRGRKGLRVQNEGIPSSAACGVGAETLSRQNSGRNVHWRTNDSMLSMSSRNPDNLPFA